MATETRPFIELLTEGRELPEGCDRWAFRAVHADLTSRGGFQYPISGRVEAPGPILNHGRDCPDAEGDGLCVAHDVYGASLGSIPLHSVLLVAYGSDDVLGNSAAKSRLRGMTVVALVDAWRLIRASGKEANLTRAYLSRANLSGADLSGAYLTRANLSRADLTGANLTRADLTRANLTGANLSGANLSGADLSRANLSGADLGDWERGPDGYGRKKATP